MENTKKVLLFHLDIMTASAVEKVAKTQGIMTISVPDTKWNLSLGNLAGVPGIPNPKDSKDPSTKGPMILMSGLNRWDMETFTDQLKKAGIATGIVKAVVTPVNIFWTPGRLYGELIREKSALKDQ